MAVHAALRPSREEFAQPRKTCSGGNPLCRRKWELDPPGLVVMYPYLAICGVVHLASEPWDGCATHSVACRPCGLGLQDGGKCWHGVGQVCCRCESHAVRLDRLATSIIDLTSAGDWLRRGRARHGRRRRLESCESVRVSCLILPRRQPHLHSKGLIRSLDMDKAGTIMTVAGKILD